MKEFIFGAGRPFDCLGRPTSFWTGSVCFLWDSQKESFRVWTEEVLGTGTVTNSISQETETDDVDSYIIRFKELETHYKKVYGE